MQTFISLKTAASILGVSHALLHRRLIRGQFHPDVVIHTDSGRPTYGFDRNRVEAQKTWRDSITQ